MMTTVSRISDEQILKEWLTEYKSLSNTAYATYAKSVNGKGDVMAAFRRAVETYSDNSLVDLVQPSCHQIFEFYRSSWKEMRMFAVGCIPAMIGGYMKSCLSSAEAASQYKVSIGTYLLAIYNLLPRSKSFSSASSEESIPENGLEIPNLAHTSIYHDPMTYPFSEHFITSRSASFTIIQQPALETYDIIIPSNRCEIMTALLSFYYDQLPVLPTCSLQQLCIVCAQLANQGFPWQSVSAVDRQKKKERRIPLGTGLAVMLVRCVYFALYDEHRSIAIKAVEAMSRRAEFELNPPLLLICNAILNTTYQETVRASDDNALGVPVSFTPMMVRTYSGVSRSAVTASSIRHHQWRHASEEVSGDVSDRLYQESSSPATESQPTSPRLLSEPNISKSEKLFTSSPGKLLKGKLKKTTPMPSAASNEKGHKDFSSSSSDKKSKKRHQHPSLEETDESQTRQRNQSGDLKSQARFASVSVPHLKQLSAEEVDGAQASPRKGAVPKSASVEQDGSSSKPTIKNPFASSHQSATDAPSEVSPPSAFGRKKSDKNKSKSSKQSKESDNKEMLSGMRRSGSKKQKELTSASVASKEIIPLLNTPSSCDEEDQNISTQL